MTKQGRTESRARLVDAAERLLRQHGYSGVSYADLSKVVGLAKASIHHHFPAKADLGVAVMLSYATRHFAALDKITARHGRAGDRLLALLALYRQTLSGGQRVCLGVALGLDPDQLPPALRQDCQAYQQRMIQWLSGVFEDGEKDQSILLTLSPGQEARSALAVLEGAQIQARRFGEVDAFVQACKSLTAQVQQPA